MGKTRLEAFSDGVIAIIITIMVLNLHIPKGITLQALKPVMPIFLTYLLSFVYVGIYWNNHHHMLHTVQKVNGKILWANLALLFWLSLFPFITGWVGQNYSASMPLALYGLIHILAACSYFTLQHFIISADGENSLLAKAVGHDFKGKFSLLCYATGIGVAFYIPWMSWALYILVALIWFLPDRRIEKVIG